MRSAWLWALALAAPTAWASTLLLNYVLTARRCSPDLVMVLSLIAVGMLLAVGATAAVALRVRRNAGSHNGGDDGSDAAGRDRFMAHLALLNCLLFGIAITAQAITPWLLHDCT